MLRIAILVVVLSVTGCRSGSWLRMPEDQSRHGESQKYFYSPRSVNEDRSPWEREQAEREDRRRQDGQR